MVNQLNTGSLSTLKPGQTLLVNARKVANGKIQLEFAEVLDNARAENILGMFNASDERFSNGVGARRHWMSVQPDSASSLLGIDFSKGDYQLNNNGHEVMELNVLNPTVEGKRLRVQIVETTKPRNEWEAENFETRAKRKGKNGDFITHKGMYIFTQSSVVFENPVNVFLEADQTTQAEGIPAVTKEVDYNTGEIFS